MDAKPRPPLRLGQSRVVAPPLERAATSPRLRPPDDPSPRLSPRTSPRQGVLQKVSNSVKHKLKSPRVDACAVLPSETPSLSLLSPSQGRRLRVVRSSDSGCCLLVDEALLVWRSRPVVLAALETLRALHPDVEPPPLPAAASAPAPDAALALLDALGADDAVARAGELRAHLCEPSDWPPLGAVERLLGGPSGAGAAVFKSGRLGMPKKTTGWTRRLVVILHGRVLCYSETETDERLPPSISVPLLLCSLDVPASGDGAELRLESPWADPRGGGGGAGGSVRFRGEDRRDCLAWLTALREVRYGLTRRLFYEGGSHAAEPLPGPVSSLFEPLPSLQLDLEWQPSRTSSWFGGTSGEGVLLKEGQIRAATPAKLIAMLLDEQQTAHTDVVSFLLTFESFITPLLLLDALASHFDPPGGGGPEGFKMRPEQLRVITVVTKWLEMCPHQFVEEDDGGEHMLASRLFGWIDSNFRAHRPAPYRKLMRAGRLVYVSPSLEEERGAAGGGGGSGGAGGGGVRGSALTQSATISQQQQPTSPRSSESLRAQVRARMAAQSAALGDNGKMRKPTLSRGATMGAMSVASDNGASNDEAGLSRSSGVASSPPKPEPVAMPYGWDKTPHPDLFEVSVVATARQLTLLEFSLFAVVPLREFHHRGWLSGGSTCPRLMRSIAFFNHVSRAVATLVVRGPVVAVRAALLAFAVRLALELRELNNFSGVVAVMAGLAMSPVHRLSRSWAAFERFHPSTHASLASLLALTSSHSNWAAMRTAVHSVTPPAIPYLGIYTSDLTFADQGNPSRIDGLVNWDKCKLEASIIRDVHLFQQTPYRHPPDVALQRLVWDLATDDDETLYERSLRQEPRSNKK